MERYFALLKILEIGSFTKAAEAMGYSQSAVSHQLRILKQNRLVKSRREGKAVFYSLADGHVRTIINQGLEHIQE